MPSRPSEASAGSTGALAPGTLGQADDAPREHDFHDLSPPDRFCDLVLTGGVTSAIAYPGLVFGLAQSYRFHGVGGSSSGAGTAALAAAAEYRRRQGSPEGFRAMLRGSLAMREDAVAPQALDGDGPAPPTRRTGDASIAASASAAGTALETALGGWIGAAPCWGPAGTASATALGNDPSRPIPTRGTRLSWLFQPDPDLQRLFDAIAPGMALGSLARTALDLLQAYGVLLNLLLAQCMFCLMLWACGALSFGCAALALPAALVAAVGGALYFHLRPELKRFIARDFGLCTGQQTLPGAPHVPLTAWLHGLIQQVAGRSAGDAPLTFADLHAARGGPDDLLGRPRTRASCSIDLRIYAANLTLGRPCVFPQSEPDAAPADAEGLGAVAAAAVDGEPGPDDGDDTLYFMPIELRRLFPDAVVDHLRAHSEPEPGQPGSDPEAQLWRLPRAQLPIIVAARISVAFPVLFRAVPLWTRHAGVDGLPGGFERCLFADGSLCSNFPIHLFDSLLPAWPTFGLALVDRPDITHYRDPEGQPAAMVDLPEASLASGRDRKHRSAAWSAVAIRGLGQYAGAMLNTVMHWHDTALARLPGVRERVVQVGLPQGIGGLNIYMNRDQIDYLASLGVEAAKVLLKRYSVSDRPGGLARGWAEHRWLRLNLLCDSLREALAGTGASAEYARHALPLSRQIDEATRQPPLAADAGRPLLPCDAAALQAALSALAQLESTLGQAPTDPTFHLDPRPVLRVQPPA